MDDPLCYSIKLYSYSTVYKYTVQPWNLLQNWNENISGGVYF